jgi:hypothetical protein
MFFLMLLGNPTESDDRFFAQGFEQNFSYTLHEELWGIMAANHCHS